MLAKNRTRAILILTMSAALSVLLPAGSVMPALGENVLPATSKRAQDVEKKISDLVTEYYPKSTITRDEETLHFEANVKRERGDYSGKPGFGPKPGGILGDVYLGTGEYNGTDQANLNCEIQDGVHSTLLMAPYTKADNVHLLARLIFPTDAPKEFRDKFRHLVNTFLEVENTAAAPAKPEKTAESGPPVPRDLLHKTEEREPVEKPAPEKPKPPGYDEAVKLFNAKKWTLARPAFQKFVKDGTADAQCYDYMAYCDYNMRQYRKAYGEFNYVGEHSPHNLSLQYSAQRAAQKLANLMYGICPGNCLKRSSGDWRVHPDGTYWYHLALPNNESQEFSEGHIGHMIVRAAHLYEDRGPCPICGGTGSVKPLRDGDPVPN